MKFFRYQTMVILCAVISFLFLIACGKPKEGKVIITDQKFTIRKDTNISWAIDANGKIKNVGSVDVKNVVVTGHCKSCGEVFTMGQWFISSELDKTAEQKATISYLPAGAEEDFSFTGVAFWPDQSGKGPEKLPDRLECEIVSFETVKK